MFLPTGSLEEFLRAHASKPDDYEIWGQDRRPDTEDQLYLGHLRQLIREIHSYRDDTPKAMARSDVPRDTLPDRGTGYR